MIKSIIQQDASEPTSGLYTDPVVRDCSDTFQNLLTQFRNNIVRAAYETADFSINNIFGSLLGTNISNNQKQAVIDRFLYTPESPGRPSLLDSKKQSAISLRQRVERFQGDMNASQLVIHAHLPGINDQLNIFMQGFYSIQSFYEQIDEILQNYKDQLNHGSIPIESIQEQARWLAVISADMKAFVQNV
ncbi:hypothetical protein QCA50_013530 [Cerrena zonata]|uniref:Uncharacterized protein n=1 Tax=Cerrena zonata TaxID=2478898 RepID=A0AAW0G025_9APHY